MKILFNRKLLFVLVLAALFTGCNSPKKPNIENVDLDSTTEYATKEVVPTEENVRYLGRTANLDDLAWLTYTNTGIEFTAKANHVGVNFWTDNSGKGARIVALVDGKKVFDEMVTENDTTLTVFNRDSVVERNVRILKVSEATSSSICIASIVVDEEGTIAPGKERDLKIEFIGDSITCGYGVDDPNRNNHFNVETEDGSKTYAYKTAEKLNADFAMVSHSGWGVVSAYTGNGEKNEGGLLPKVYEKLSFTYGSFFGQKPQEIDWDFSKYVPDVVVINLGTNDNSYVKGNSDKAEEFKSGYVDFIKTVRKNNPDAYIICSLGLMGQDLFPQIDKAVSEYSAATGDKKICSLQFDVQNAADGICADWHPSEATHEKAAIKLVMKIKELKLN